MGMHRRWDDPCGVLHSAPPPSLGGGSLRASIIEPTWWSGTVVYVRTRPTPRAGDGPQKQCQGSPSVASPSAEPTAAAATELEGAEVTGRGGPASRWVGPWEGGGGSPPGKRRQGAWEWGAHRAGMDGAGGGGQVFRPLRGRWRVGNTDPPPNHHNDDGGFLLPIQPWRWGPVIAAEESRQGRGVFGTGCPPPTQMQRNSRDRTHVNFRGPLLVLPPSGKKADARLRKLPLKMKMPCPVEEGGGCS